MYNVLILSHNKLIRVIKHGILIEKLNSMESV